MIIGIHIFVQELITMRYPPARGPLQAAPGASVEAAVAAANRVTLAALAPVQQATIDKAYQAALATLPDGPAKTAGIAVGEQAATAILALQGWGQVLQYYIQGLTTQ
jgi:hypothetical protein